MHQCKILRHVESPVLGAAPLARGGVEACRSSLSLARALSIRIEGHLPKCVSDHPNKPVMNDWNDIISADAAACFFHRLEHSDSLSSSFSTTIHSLCASSSSPTVFSPLEFSPFLARYVTTKQRLSKSSGAYPSCNTVPRLIHGYTCTSKSSPSSL